MRDHDRRHAQSVEDVDDIVTVDTAVYAVLMLDDRDVARLSNSEAAATDAGESATSSPTTRALEGGDPSATRTTLTSAPSAVNPLDSAALKVASPHAVGGCVVRMPKCTGSEKGCSTMELVSEGRVDKNFNVIQTCGWHLHDRA